MTTGPGRTARRILRRAAILVAEWELAGRPAQVRPEELLDEATLGLAVGDEEPEPTKFDAPRPHNEETDSSDE